MSDKPDRRYRYRVTPRSGGFHAYVGGMQTDDMEPVKRDGATVLFPDEIKALRGSIDTLLRMIHSDITAWRSEASINLRRPSSMQLIQETFGDAETTFVRPGKSVIVEKKGKRKRVLPY